MKYIVIIVFLLVEGCTLIIAQNPNIDTLYFRVGKDVVVRDKIFKEITISKDSSEVNGFLRWSNGQLYYKSLYNKPVKMIDVKCKLPKTIVRYFGYFSSFVLTQKDFDTYKIETQLPIASHQTLLKEILIKEYSESNVCLVFKYIDGFGRKKESQILLTM